MSGEQATDIIASIEQRWSQKCGGMSDTILASGPTPLAQTLAIEVVPSP